MEFCPRCGCNLNGGEYVCPECGNVLRVEPEVTVSSAPRSGKAVWVFFAIGFLVMFSLTFFVGLYFLFFFIPIIAVGGRRSRSSMLLTGAMTGAVLGLLLRFLL